MKNLFILVITLIICSFNKSNAQDCFCTLGITSFTSTTIGNTVKLSWTTSGELSTGVSYNIEKSNNGTDFYLIGTVNYQHVSTGNYTFTDNCGKPASGINTVYFRLKSLGINGTTKTSSSVVTNVSSLSPGTCYGCDGSLPLSGPSNICSGTTANYSMGFTSTPVTWSLSSSTYATLTVGPIANTASVHTTSTNQSVTLTATLAGCSTPYHTSILLGPIVTIKDSATPTCTSGNYQTWILDAVPSTGGTNYYWSIDHLNTGGDIFINNPPSPQTFVDVKGSGGVKLSWIDACGNPQSNVVTIYSTCHSFSMSPNPSSNYLTITNIATGTNNLIYKIKITDRVGRLKKMYQFKSGINSKQISLSDIMFSGTYFVSVFDGTNWSTQSLIVNK